MIHYALRCAAGHAFDGWFKDSAAFDAQSKQNFLACPECGDGRVSRALMAPAIANPAPPPQQKAAQGLPDEMRAALQRIRAEVERNSDYVGPNFADEARRIHDGEAERRSIYGESTREEAESLAEDGIAFTQIPWVPRADG